MPDYSPEQILEILDKAECLFKDGRSVDQVCSQLHVSKSDLEIWLERYAMPPEAMDVLNGINTGDCIVPIFEGTGVGDAVEQIGSGVAVAIGPERYVLTAAHVTDNWKEKELYIPSKSGIISVSGTLFSRPLDVSESRNDDMIDVSYFRLSKELAQELHDTIQPLKIEEIDLSGNCDAGAL